MEKFSLSQTNKLTLKEFYEIVFLKREIEISESAKLRLNETREFVQFLLKSNRVVYGLTTGFADLRNFAVTPDQAGQLSDNIIESHDAGIGKPLPEDVVLGAMLVRANSLAKGNSAFKFDSLETLVQMINARIVPIIPCTGSLGASGDLAFLARLGKAMKGDSVPVMYQGDLVTAGEALKQEGIRPFSPDAKEGLALTNGTAFMASMLAIGYIRELHELENILALQGIFLNAAQASEGAFLKSLHDVRGQMFQSRVAELLSSFILDTPFMDEKGVQDDYSIRCLPQIIGPKLEVILAQYPSICRELDAVTDNPLIFKDEEISPEVSEKRIYHFNDSKWAVISGGNFHGENLASAADAIKTANVKLALTMERQMTFLLNPKRNKANLPVYLIKDEKNTGLFSGFMVTQYTGNALAQKIALLGVPVSIYNITSANESEDIVSYGATAGEYLLEQLELLHQFNTIYLTMVIQAYSIARAQYPDISEDLFTEKAFTAVLEHQLHEKFPIEKDISFEKVYQDMSRFLKTTQLRELVKFPLLKALSISDFYENPIGDLAFLEG